MGEKLDESRNASDGDKDLSHIDAILNSSGSSGGQEDGEKTLADRRILAAKHNMKQDSLLLRLFKFVFYIPLKILSLFGLNILQARLELSGNAKINNSPLRPASTSPQKRKRDDRDASDVEFDDENEVAKLLEEDADYDSQQDDDFKPGEESSCSDEYAEGDTEGELSKLSIEDVSEPRPSSLRNLTVVDDGEKKDKEKTVTTPAVIVPKCIDEPISKPEITPATVGVMG
ncbi:uncharacterized protein [Diadema antillarum]|uniref:uncharacterized protein n=1 Tax=Diadema antillarum TaxID=105358 RepID=UPI003A844BE8